MELAELLAMIPALIDDFFPGYQVYVAAGAVLGISAVLFRMMFGRW